MVKIAPSMLSADFANLGRDTSLICESGADYLHMDVMDGTFVPNISYGADVIKSTVPYASVPFDVHLMVQAPERYIENFVTENTEFITVHAEACEDAAAVISQIKSYGIKAGISISPETPVDRIAPVLGAVDLVLVMSVHPGFGGQSFMPEVLDKTKELVRLREAHGYDYVIEMDGGIKASNAALVRDAGTDIIVAGSAVFKAEDKAETIRALRG